MEHYKKASEVVCLALAGILNLAPENIEGYRISGRAFSTISENFQQLASGRCLRRTQEIDLSSGSITEASWLSSEPALVCNTRHGSYIRLWDCPVEVDMGVVLNQFQHDEGMQFHSMKCMLQESAVFVPEINTFAVVDWGTLKVTSFWSTGQGPDYSPARSAEKLCAPENTEKTELMREQIKREGGDFFGEYKEWFPKGNL